ELCVSQLGHSIFHRRLDRQRSWFLVYHTPRFRSRQAMRFHNRQFQCRIACCAPRAFGTWYTTRKNGKPLEGCGRLCPDLVREETTEGETWTRLVRLSAALRSRCPGTTWR